MDKVKKKSLRKQQHKRKQLQLLLLKTTKAAQSDANEVKTVYQLVNTNVTTKLTLYSKGNIIERTITEVITDFSVDNIPEASREAVKQSYEIQKSVLEQTYGDLKNKITELKGFKFDSKKKAISTSRLMKLTTQLSIVRN